MHVPEGYAVAISAMLARARLWLGTKGKAGLSFTLPPQDLLFVAGLTGPALSMLAPTETGRAFLRALDDAAKKEGTAFQACIVIRSLELPVTDWSEAYCAKLVQQRKGKAS